MSQPLLQDAEKSSFKETSIPQPEPFSDLALALQSLRRDDANWKIKARRSYGKAIFGLLCFQNLAVFGITYVAYFQGRFSDLQVVLPIVVSATLAETAFMIKIMVKWLFQDIDYKTS